LKCINLIEIRFYVSSFLVLWDHCADTGSWIRGQIRVKIETGGLVSSQWKKCIKYSVYHVTDLANEIVRKPHVRTNCDMKFINLTRKIARCTCSSVRGSNKLSKPIRIKKTRFATVVKMLLKLWYFIC
jgi:hypothetical protein